MDKMKKCEKVLNIIGGLVALIYICTFLFYTTRACLDDPADYTVGPINNIGTVMFVFLGVVFFTVGIMMNLSLKWHFPEFYKQYRCLLWTVTLLLTFPLFIRGIKDHFYNYSESFRTFYDSHFVFDNTVYALLSTVLPIITQTGSLIFGFMRARENQKKKSKKDKNKHSLLGLTGGSGGFDKNNDITEGTDMESESDDSSTSNNGQI